MLQREVVDLHHRRVVAVVAQDVLVGVEDEDAVPRRLQRRAQYGQGVLDLFLALLALRDIGYGGEDQLLVGEGDSVEEYLHVEGAAILGAPRLPLELPAAPVADLVPVAREERKVVFRRGKVADDGEGGELARLHVVHPERPVVEAGDPAVEVVQYDPVVDVVEYQAQRLLGILQRLLHAPAVRDVACDAGEADDVTPAVVYRRAHSLGPDRSPVAVDSRLVRLLADPRLHDHLFIQEISRRELLRPDVEIGLPHQLLRGDAARLAESLVHGDEATFLVLQPGQVWNVVEDGALLLLPLLQNPGGASFLAPGHQDRKGDEEAQHRGDHQHALAQLVEAGEVLALFGPYVESADHLPLRVPDRIVGGKVRNVENHRLAAVRFPLEEDGAVCGALEPGTHGSAPVGAPHVGGDAHVTDEDGGGAAENRLDLVRDFVVAVEGVGADPSLAVGDGDGVPLAVHERPEGPDMGFVHHVCLPDGVRLDLRQEEGGGGPDDGHNDYDIERIEAVCGITQNRTTY